MSDTAKCPWCEYAYESRAFLPERRRLASAIAVQQHAERVHGKTAVELAAAARAAREQTPDYHDGQPCDCYPPRPPELRPCDEYAARAAATATYPTLDPDPREAMSTESDG